MDKNYYFAIIVCKQEKKYAHIVKVGAMDNVLNMLDIPGIYAANICPTRKRAFEIVNHWNACFKANNEYLFDSPSF